MCEELVQYGKEGLTKSEVASKFGLTRKTLYEWVNMPGKYPEFVAAWEVYETEFNAYLDRNLSMVCDGKVKLSQGQIAAIIYRLRVCMGPKNPEYLIDLKREIKTETVPSRDTINAELKRLLELARNDRVIQSGEFDSGTTVKAISAPKG